MITGGSFSKSVSALLLGGGGGGGGGGQVVRYIVILGEVLEHLEEAQTGQECQDGGAIPPD